MPRAKPEVLVVEHDLIGRGTRVVGGVPLRSVVDDHELVGNVGVAAHRVGELLRVEQVVPGEHDHRELRLGRRGRDASAAARTPGPRRRPSRTASNSSVRRSQSKSRSTSSSPLATSRAASASSSRSRRIASAMARASRGGTTSAVSPSMAYSRQPPLSVVTSGVPHASDFEAGLAEPLEPAPDREHPSRRVLPAERGLVEVLARVRARPERRGARPRRESCRCPSTRAAARRCRGAGCASHPDTAGTLRGSHRRAARSADGRSRRGSDRRSSCCWRAGGRPERAGSPSCLPCCRACRRAARRTRGAGRARSDRGGATAARG